MLASILLYVCLSLRLGMGARPLADYFRNISDQGEGAAPASIATVHSFGRETLLVTFTFSESRKHCQAPGNLCNLRELCSFVCLLYVWKDGSGNERFRTLEADSRGVG